MRIIGLCGRSGSGKSTLCRIASQKGIKVIDCDSVYKELVSKPSPCLLEIAEYFGEKVIKDNALNRRYLAPLVFSDSEKLRILNQITHKHILLEINNIISAYSDDDIVILDAPALFESGLQNQCDLIVGVVASDDLSISRIVSRDNISETEAKKRLSSQYSTQFIEENCDIVLYNTNTPEEFESAVTQFADKLKENSI